MGLQKSHIVLLLAMLSAGAFNTIALTLQNKQFVFEGTHYKHFYHPFIQSTLHFVASFLVLIAYLVTKRIAPNIFKRNEEQAIAKNKSLKIKKWLMIVPAIIDLLNSLLHYTALNFIAGSVYQIMRGGTVLTTYLFSIYWLKSKPSKAKLSGAIVVLIGLVIVGLSNYIFTQTQTNSDTIFTLVGYLLLLLSLFSNGLLFVYEEKLLSKYYVEPLHIVGLQGLYGLAFNLLLLPIIYMLPCIFPENACVYNENNESFIENIFVFARETADNSILLYSTIGIVISMAIYNSTGVTVTKHLTSLARSICDVSRTLVIWIVGVIITASIGQQNKSFKWQNLSFEALLLQAFGFLLLVLGNLIYYEVILANMFKPRPLLEQWSLLQTD